MMDCQSVPNNHQYRSKKLIMFLLWKYKTIRRLRFNDVASNSVFLILQLAIDDFRWRNSFFFSLLFGVPVMAVMIYFMADMHMSMANQTLMMNISAPNVTVTGPDIAQMMPHNTHVTYMVMPGLSLENLLLFLLCTPCLVRCSDFKFNSLY